MNGASWASGNGSGDMAQAGPARRPVQRDQPRHLRAVLAQAGLGAHGLGYIAAPHAEVLRSGGAGGQSDLPPVRDAVGDLADAAHDRASKRAVEMHWGPLRGEAGKPHLATACQKGPDLAHRSNLAHYPGSSARCGYDRI